MNNKDVDQLLTHYRGERRRLIFQLDQVRTAIVELKKQAVPVVGSEADVPVKRGPGRPRKVEVVKLVHRRKPGRKKKRTIKNGGYRLSSWDLMITGYIERTGKLQPKEDLFRETLAWAKKHKPKMNHAEVETKLTRVLQKLSGKRGVLGKHRSGLRRGYHYGLMDWFYASTGKLRASHLDRLHV